MPFPLLRPLAIIRKSMSSKPEYRYRIFVYGTLKPGGYYYNRICLRRVPRETPATARGLLFDLPAFGYPAATEGDGTIHGYLLEFNEDALMADIDRLEGYSPKADPAECEYLRKAVTVGLRAGNHDDPVAAPAEMYFMNRERIAALGGVRVESGDWPHL